ncbi:MAG: Ig-like domain-containing protein, partial [Saprospiraceae bacterium]|nr:Ig-like domain-containing protein [Saprospiraceae bacterium]
MASLLLVAVSGIYQDLYGQCTPNTVTVSTDTICAGGSSIARGNNVPGIQTYLWQVSIDNGPWMDAQSPNTGQNSSLPTSYETTPGSYTFRRIVEDTTPTACKDTSATVTVTVVADLSSVTIGTAATVCVGATHTLNLLATTGGSGNWAYDWERSTTGTGGWTNASAPQNQATYSVPTTSPGTTYYRQLLDDSGSGCGDNVPSNVLAVTVVADPVGPTLTKIPSDLTVCSETTLTVSVTPGTGGTGTCSDEYRYSTDGGNNWSNWTDTIPSFSAVPGGFNTIEARRVCDGSGCDTSTVNSVFWIVLPLPKLNITGDDWLCEGSMLQLIGTADVQLSTFLWSSSNEAVATVDQTGKVTAVAAGMATIQFEAVATNGCSDTVGLEITVHALPEPVISGDTLVCAGALLQLGASPGGGAWASLDETIATVDDGEVTGVMAGIAGITYTVSDDNMCVATDTFYVYVNQPPTVAVDELTSYCVGVVLTHTATLNPAAPTSGAYAYFWEACASANCTTCNTGSFIPSHTVATPTRQWNTINANRSVKLTVGTPGCTATAMDCESFSIVADPVAPVLTKIPPDATVCPDI